ncbi:MAG: hypothetical protein HQL71_04700 [Magnetococcales bacterium]|nr:hypothetical protein [Magnetococcales bacterium]
MNIKKFKPSWQSNIALVMVILLFPLLLNLFLNATYYDDRYKKALAIQKPHDLFIGNSLISRFDFKLLGDLMPNRKVYGIKVSASSPAMWYRIIKNDVLPSGAKPEAIYFILRANLVVSPIVAPATSQQIRILRHSAQNEPFFLQEIKNSPNTLGLRFLFTSVYAIQSLNEIFDWYLTNITMLLSHGSYQNTFINSGHGDRMKIRFDFLDSLNTRMEERRFSAVNKVLTKVQGYKPKPTNFKEALPNSYLPHIISLLQNNDILPVFIYVKVLEMKEDKQVKLTIYDKNFRDDLKEYLTQNGAVYIEEDIPLTRDMFADFLHLDYEYVPYYTKQFLKTYGDECKTSVEQYVTTCNTWKFFNEQATK